MFNRELRFVERCVSWKAINSYRKIQAQLMQTCNCYDCTKDCKLHNFQSFQSLLKTTSDLSTNSKPKHVESENAPKKVVRYCNSFLFSLSHLHFILQHPRTPLAFQQSPPSIHFLTYQPFFPLQNPNTACSTWNSFLWTFTQTKKKKKAAFLDASIRPFPFLCLSVPLPCVLVTVTMKTPHFTPCDRFQLASFSFT